jgi:3-deoxy-manno-octulosonate cytidylyltransferase (CMP-KDO synthetase)
VHPVTFTQASGTSAGPRLSARIVSARIVSAKIVAVIPARYQSTRLPGKALADIAGQPMIEHVYRRSADAAGIDAVIIATDDERIAAAARGFGGEVMMTSASHRSGTDRVAEVARSLQCDIVVNVQGDEPLIPAAMIEEVIAPFRDASVVMTTLRRRIVDDADRLSPHVVKVVVDRNDDALYFSRVPIPYTRNAGTDVPAGTSPAFKHVGLYGYRRAFLLELAALAPTPLELSESLEQLRALEHGFRIRTPETIHDSVGVDTPEDLERARRQLAELAATARK